MGGNLASSQGQTNTSMYISAATVKDDPALLPTLDTSVSEQKADLAKILPFLYVDGLSAVAFS